MKNLVLAVAALLSSSAFANTSLPNTLYICSSPSTRLSIAAKASERTLDVYDANGALIRHYPNIYPTYNYNDAMNPMLIDVNFVHAITGKLILEVSQQGEKIVAAYEGDFSYTCTKE